MVDSFGILDGHHAAYTNAPYGNLIVGRFKHEMQLYFSRLRITATPQGGFNVDDTLSTGVNE